MDWIDYKGAKVITIDYSGLSGQELLDKINNNHKEILRLGEEGNSALLLLTDVTDTRPDKRILAALREHAATDGVYILASAVIGVTGMKKYMMNFLNIASPYKSKAFDNEEDAKKWLLVQAERNRS